jgi:hypothetical protein
LINVMGGVLLIGIGIYDFIMNLDLIKLVLGF